MVALLSYSNITQSDLERRAAEIALALGAGDLVALQGDLGAGKTTFARALIRALAQDDAIEVPSPTFTLTQTYETPRFTVTHADLYRLQDAAETDALGFDEALRTGVVIVEWPERATQILNAATVIVSLMDSGADARSVSVKANSTSAHSRLSRLRDLQSFISQHGWGDSATRISYMQGDASARRYARLQKANGDRAILMDQPRQPDGPPIKNGLPYSRIAHLAEDVTPFVAIAAAIKKSGLSVPDIYAADLERGLLLIEDFGDAVFGAQLKSGEHQAPLWIRATETLVALRSVPAPPELQMPGHAAYHLPDIDNDMLAIEVSLLIDWYYPAVTSRAASDTVRNDFFTVWQPVFDHVMSQPKGWLLRDYHSPNLLALNDRAPPTDIGIIDFQDALRGPHAYDLVSVLQDARVDVSRDLEKACLHRYLDRVSESDKTFDPSAFTATYHALGAQRATKILGIFARLAKRDGKRQYLQHIPRMWNYLDRNLSAPILRDVAQWYAMHIPPATRSKELVV
jgi:N-acetylmuramate 1-kinase